MKITFPPKKYTTVNSIKVPKAKPVIQCNKFVNLMCPMCKDGADSPLNSQHSILMTYVAILKGDYVELCFILCHFWVPRNF